jgi:hypothetical protein
VRDAHSQNHSSGPKSFTVIQPNDESIGHTIDRSHELVFQAKRHPLCELKAIIR